MSLRERVIRALGGYTSREEAIASAPSYISKIPHVDLPPETEIDGPELRRYLKLTLTAAGLTKGQRSGVSNALGKTAFSKERGEEDLTIGDIQRMTDEELRSRVVEWENHSWHPDTQTILILRQLFGKTS